MKKKYRYIYGPVNSWRLGASLGIDPLSRPLKTCSFDCTYCQIGRTREPCSARKVFVPTIAVVDEISSIPGVSADYLTLAGAGEPTLAKNLAGMINTLKIIRDEKVAVITNSSLIDDEDVRYALSRAGLVLAKLDAPNESVFRKINRPAPGLKFSGIIKGLKRFREEYSKELAIQIMFTGDNKGFAKELAALIKRIKPDEVQVNTPTRPCAVKPLSKTDILEIKEVFNKECAPEGIRVISVYDRAAKKAVKPISSKETIRRRGKPV